MGSNDRNHDVLVPEAKSALDKMKLEIANDLSLDVPHKDDWGNVPSRECGKFGGQIGGKMVRNMIRIAEQHIMDK